MGFIHLVDQGVDVLSGLGGSEGSHGVRNSVHTKAAPSRSLFHLVFCTFFMADSRLNVFSVLPAAFAGGDRRWERGFRKLPVPVSTIFHILYPAPLCGAYRAAGPLRAR